MHSAIDTGHGMTNWPSNMLEIHHSGEHFVAGGLTVANYSAPWESSVRNLYSPRHPRDDRAESNRSHESRLPKLT